MSNTFDTALLVDTVTQKLNSIAPTRLAMLKGYAFDVDAEQSVQSVGNGKLRNNVISITTSSATIQKNPTAFGENAASVVEGRKVTLDLYSLPISLTYLQKGQGFSLEQLIENAVINFTDGLAAAATAPLSSRTTGETPANIFAKSYGVTLADYDTREEIATLFRALWTSQRKGAKKCAFLDADLFGLGMPENLNSFDPTKGDSQKVRGFDLFAENNLWPENFKVSTADKRILGVVTDGAGLCFAARQLDWMGIEGLTTETITIPGLGLPVQLNMWGNLSDRSLRATLDIAFGASHYDTSATTVIYEE